MYFEVVPAARVMEIHELHDPCRNVCCAPDVHKSRQWIWDGSANQRECTGALTPSLFPVDG